jgi:replicative superfamily II helicase
MEKITVIFDEVTNEQIKEVHCTNLINSGADQIEIKNLNLKNERLTIEFKISYNKQDSFINKFVQTDSYNNCNMS